MVPSSGSTIQRRPLVPAVSEPSSPEQPVVGARSEQAVADQPLGGDVGLRDEVGGAALRVDPEVGLERLAQLRAGRPGDLLGELDHAATSGTRSAHGRSASIWAASESSVASSPGRPTSWTASGKPSGVNPAGTEAAGWPVWL